MSQKFSSGCKTTVGATIQSALNVRGCGADLVFGGDFVYTDTSKNNNDVGSFKAGDKFLRKIGKNNQIGSGLTVETLLEFKKKLYVTGGLDALPRNDAIGLYDPKDGEWDNLTAQDMNGPIKVGEDLCLWNDLLVVVGRFFSVAAFTSTTNGIGGWNATAWVDMSATTSDWPVNVLRACIDWKGSLVVGGFNMDQKTKDANILSKYFTGSVWANLASVDDTFLEKEVLTYATFGDLLFIGGISVCKTISVLGGTYDQIGGSFDDTIFGAVEFKKKLYVCGGFDKVGTPSVFADNTAVWDGLIWKQVGKGLLGGSAFAIHVHNKKLYCIGNFTTNGDSDSVIGIAVLNEKDDKWEQLASGDNTLQTFSFGRTLATTTVNVKEVS